MPVARSAISTAWVEFSVTFTIETCIAVTALSAESTLLVIVAALLEIDTRLADISSTAVATLRTLLENSSTAAATVLMFEPISPVTPATDSAVSRMLRVSWAMASTSDVSVCKPVSSFPPLDTTVVRFERSLPNKSESEEAILPTSPLATPGSQRKSPRPAASIDASRSESPDPLEPE